MGYVAELQQFDSGTASRGADEPTLDLAREPHKSTAGEVAAAAGDDVATVEFARQSASPRAQVCVRAATTLDLTPSPALDLTPSPTASPTPSPALDPPLSPDAPISYDVLARDPLAYYALARANAGTVHERAAVGSAVALYQAPANTAPVALRQAGPDAGPYLEAAPLPGRVRRRRLALLSVATAALVAAGAAYALIETPSSSRTAQPAPALPPQVATSGYAPFRPGVPGVAARSAQASPSGSGSASPTVPAGTSASVAPNAGPASRKPVAAESVAPVPSTVPPSSRPPVRPVPPPQGAPAPPSARRLVATFTHTADLGPLGLAGYVGTVDLTNPGAAERAGWRLRLTVPGGNVVSSDGPVTVVQDGERVTFTPRGDAGTVPPGGSVSFTFQVAGILAAEPSGCALNGRACG